MSEALPPEVADLLERRSAARARRDWAEADALRDRLRDLGWEPIDSPSGSTARPALPAQPGGPTGYARPEDLASLLDEPAGLAASLVVVVEDHPDDLQRLVDGLRAWPPSASWELVVVANRPAPGRPVSEIAAGLPASVLPTTERLGWADAANLGLRRVRGGVAVLLDTSVEPRGDFVGPLVAAFDDPAVGIAGPWGATSSDGRSFEEASHGEVDAVLAYCLAIRREALRAVGGFDRRYRWYRHADLDLSFAVRDAGWRAAALPGLPLERHEHRGWSDLDEAERARLSKRNFYRFLGRWGERPDLLRPPPPDA